ncbi:GNAT family N-acetyltransferase [Anaerotignum sp. MB30-C6]|uniref:GNAT family N-acetyltransferase n=1 Tax=Anaerotignum sp. MB30-C6 TaxID=3070814 RepID=UPI0027DC7E00|nr:GNAT family protein [Anaerotignum sp. MB30-C6]WMI80743.1 GNAT family protein [Anaerotignum sp. MB30-C6]
MKLRPYKNSDAKHVVQWVKDETTYYQWCAGLIGEYPLKEERLNMYYDKLQDNTACWGMTAEDEMGVVGHMCMRFLDRARETVRLGFVLVDHERRGQGLGRELVSMGIRYAHIFLGAKQISLGVYAGNTCAKKCYESLGFVQDGDLVIKYEVKEEDWDCIEMILTDLRK